MATDFDRFDWLELGGARETDLRPISRSRDHPTSRVRPCVRMRPPRLPLTSIDRFAPVPTSPSSWAHSSRACSAYSDRFALVPHLHRGCTLLAPASSSCSRSPSSSSESWPRPHHNDRRLTVCPDLVELPPGPRVQGCWGDELARPPCHTRETRGVRGVGHEHIARVTDAARTCACHHSSHTCCPLAFSLK